MASNRWMVLSLFFGILMAVAMVSSVPIYTNGVLTRMLIKDLESFQVNRRTYPGRFSVIQDIPFKNYRAQKDQVYDEFNTVLTDRVERDIDLPVSTLTTVATREYNSMLPEIQREEDPRKRFPDIVAMKGLQDRIEITHGRAAATEAIDGIYEVLVTEAAYNEMNLQLEEVYELYNMLEEELGSIRIRVTGIFAQNDFRDTYWHQGLWAYEEAVLIDYDLFLQELLMEPSTTSLRAEWHWAFDYHSIETDDVSRILEAHDNQLREARQRGISVKFPILSILEEYQIREEQLRATLWVIQVPVLLMLVFYLFMVSQMTVEHEKNEIAVIKSRGGSSGQIFVTYLVEIGILSVLALVFGPPLGLFICQILGASNGFLEFVQRTALPVRLTTNAYVYSVGAVVLAMTSILLPAYSASKTTIVQHKQKLARGRNRPMWKRFFLDFVLLAVAGYGLYQYNLRQEILATTGAEGVEITIDPLLFLISTIFVLGAGLLFIRVFPYLIRLVFRLGKRSWTPVPYAAFTHVGRSSGKDQFLMLFMILSISVGIFSADSARTMNSSVEERVRYMNGADIALMQEWTDANEAGGSGAFDPLSGEPPPDTMTTSEPPRYIEPAFRPIEKLHGVQQATKVFKVDNVATQTMTGKRVNPVSMISVIPNEFGRVAWFRTDLLPSHWFNYLNLLTHSPAAALVSSGFRDEYGVELGETLRLTWGRQGFVDVYVYGFIDYWPSYNPYSRNGRSAGHLVVTNLNYVQAMAALEPYEVWMKRSPTVSSEEFYEALSDEGLRLLWLKDTRQDIIKERNDPMVQGTNGALTMGFTVTLGIAIIGFLIYWILSIKERVLQFGIFRAMGMSVRRIIGILAWEQILISGTAIFAGIAIGRITSRVFVPLLQIAYSARQQVPPFRVTSEIVDYFRIYGVVALMFTAGIVILGVIISRIQMHQALKLGEE
jgi:putative ABC transport system permease protein